MLPYDPGAILNPRGLGMRQTVLITMLALLVSAATRADDFKLKDGSKISGTIVGFDDNSFKVKTNYGFALVRKDQVVSITVSDAAKTGAEKQAKGSSETPASAATAAKITPSTVPAVATPAAVAAQPNASATPGAAAPPPAPSAPAPIREEVDGSMYVNETYRFRMFKPPDWEVIAGARSIMPGAIAAMGTGDQTTYLLIGEAPTGKSLTSDIDATDQRLRTVMDNFRPLGESRMNVSGIQSVEKRFRGSVDQKDWSGTVVFVQHGNELYTIFGMTLAQSDLVQIQENVIAKAISSLQFAQ